MPEEKTTPAAKADDATAEQLAAVLSDDPEANEGAFEDAFDEFAATDDTDTTTTPAAPVEGPEDGDKADTDASTTPDDDAAASGDDPSDATGDEDQTAAPDGAAEDDIWKDASPDQKAAFKAAQHENQSNRNRASAQNRKIAELMSAPKPAAKPAAAPTASPETVENWEKFKTEYPEVAGPLAERMDRQDQEIANLKGENADLKGQVTGITDANTQTAIDTEEAVLLKRHPDWQQFTASAEFIAWLPTQPRYVQEGLARNGAAIVDGDEAASLLDLFKDDHATPETTEPAEETPKPATPATTNGKATRRARRIESAVTAEPGQAGPGGGPPEGDFDTAFDHFAKQP